MALGMASQGVSPLADDAGTGMGKGQPSFDRLPGLYYYAAPKSPDDGPKSLDEVDPKLLETYEKLGIPLKEQEMLAGVAVDAVFDSVSVATTYKAKLEEQGIIFCSISKLCNGARSSSSSIWAQSSLMPTISIPV